MKKNISSVIITAMILILIGVLYYNFFVLPNQKDSYECLVNKGYSWCDFKNQCVKEGEEDCSLTQDWILSEAKKIIGLDLNVIPNQTVKWNTKEGEIAFSAKGIYYADLLKAEKVIKGFKDLDEFLNKAGLEKNPDNPPVISDKENTIKYDKEKIVCELKKSDNSNNTSSLSLFCGNTDDRSCSFESDCGRGCSSDSDCDFIVDGCRKIIVCRAKGYKFYHDCQNPTSNVGELDVSINSCLCLENQCVPKNEKFRSKN